MPLLLAFLAVVGGTSFLAHRDKTKGRRKKKGKSEYEDETSVGGEGGGGGETGNFGGIPHVTASPDVPTNETPHAMFQASDPANPGEADRSFIEGERAQEAAQRAQEAAEAAAEQQAEAAAAAAAAAAAPQYPTLPAQQAAIDAGVPAGPGGVVPYESQQESGFLRVGKPRKRK